MRVLKHNLRIAVSGKSGCGNTSVCRKLSSLLGLQLVNWTFRNLADERGMTLEQVIESAKHDPSYDRLVDTRQVELARQQPSVLGSRLAIWMLDDADFKVFLTASAETRASRIVQREGGNFDEVFSFTKMRDSEDSRRYLELYGIDNSSFDFADLVVNTEDYDIDGVVNLILQGLKSKNLIDF